MTAPGNPRQPLEALARGNQVRLARVEIKRDIAQRDRKAGMLRAAEIIADPGPDLRSMPTAAIIGAIHRWGASLSRRQLERLRIPELKPIGDLTSRQRDMLIVALGGEAPARVVTEALAPRPAPARIPRPPAPSAPAALAAAPSATDWCPACTTEVVVNDDTRRCLWCGTPTRKAIAA